MCGRRAWRSILLAVLFSSASRADAPSLKWYGFVLPFYSLATSGTESFSNPNQGAISAAGNPVLAGASSGNLRSTFQVAQSRVGFTISPAPTLDARVELDFIDFTKSSPTLSANPRLRRAVLSYVLHENFKLQLGQDWDLISPLMPFTYNFVGHFFEAGDIGFMRHQLTGLWSHGAWETGFALGLPSQNATFSDGNSELTVVPTISFRETYHGEGWSAGASAMFASLRASSTSRIGSGAITAFGTVKNAQFEFRTEGYWGRNTQNLGLLGLSFCNATNAGNCPDEAGFYVSAKRTFGPASVFASLGGAAVLRNLDSVLASYDPTKLTLAGTGPGIESNWTAHFGGDYKIAEGALFWGEVSFWSTRHHLAAGATASPQASALVFQVGSQVSF